LSPIVGSCWRVTWDAVRHDARCPTTSCAVSAVRSRLAVRSGEGSGVRALSTAKHDLDRQLHALAEAGIPTDRIYVEKRSGVSVDRPGLRALVGYTGSGDVIVVHAVTGSAAPSGTP
jgi:hypothetical protein